MKIYTRGGDQGHTSLLGGSRVPKTHPRIDAYGTVDELSCVIGMARAASPDFAMDNELALIQMDLFEIGALLASPEGDERFPGAPSDRVAAIEKAIDSMESELSPLKSFILPGGSPGAAVLHLARTTCRRAERRVLAIGDESDRTRAAIIYLNRLSDFLFVAARFANLRAGVEDVPWNR